MNVSLPLAQLAEPVRRMRTRTADAVLWAIALAGLPALVFRIGSVIPYPEHYASTSAVVLAYILIVGVSILRSLPVLPPALARLTGQSGGLTLIAISTILFAILAGLGAAGVMDAWMAYRDSTLALSHWIEELITNAFLIAMSAVLLLSFDRFLDSLRHSNRRIRRDIEFFE